MSSTFASPIMSGANGPTIAAGSWWTRRAAARFASGSSMRRTSLPSERSAAMTQPTDPTALAAARELVNLVIVEWEWDEVSAEFRESLAQAIAAHTDAAVKEKDERLRLGGYNYTILAQQNGDLRVQLAAAEKTIRQLDISPNEAGEMVTLRTKLAERERDDCLAKLAAAEGELAKWPVRYDNMCRTSYAHQELKRV